MASWRFIDKVLGYFDFGPSIRNGFQLFIKTHVLQSHGVEFLSAFFMLGRGCRQGDPISTYLFVLCAEILASKIRSNKNIKGIKINNTEIKLSQYADDTSAYLDDSQTSLEETLNELDILPISPDLRQTLIKLK